jgi:hypothetical protein
MHWQALPGPAAFIDGVVQLLRDGISVVVAAPTYTPSGFERAFVERFEDDGWYMQQVAVDTQEEPLEWITERLYLEPEKWVGWSVEKFFERLSPGQIVAVEGVTETTWGAWRTFLRDFEVASRRRASDERAVLLVFVRGVPRKRLQGEGAALAMRVWEAIFGELDTLIYVDQRLRSSRSPARHHKLIVRQIAALALWDLDLADFLTGLPDQDLFDPHAVLQAGRESLGRGDIPMAAAWELGGLDRFDGVETLHPFVLVDQGDPKRELKRRLWAAQAAELLPLIEMRRRELAKGLERHVSCPFWIDKDRLVRSLYELEIGSLAHVTRTNGIKGYLKDLAEWLAECRNTLAHLGVLSGADATDARLHAWGT